MQLFFLQKIIANIPLKVKIMSSSNAMNVKLELEFCIQIRVMKPSKSWFYHNKGSINTIGL